MIRSNEQADGNDADGDTLAFSRFGPGPVRGTLDLDPDGNFTYTPGPDFNESSTMKSIISTSLKVFFAVSVMYPPSLFLGL